jgi:CRP/FNR family transcriptional regulator
MNPLPSFLKSAPAAIQSSFEQHAVPFRLAAGREVLAAGGRCTSMSFVVTGAVRVYLMGRDGREVTLYRVRNGDACVLTASCILGGTAFPAGAIVEKDAAGCAVPSALFREWVDRTPYWRGYVFRLLGERMAAVLEKFEESTFGSIDARLARVLVRRARAGERPIVATQQSLAVELGTAREVISRTLSRWKREGLVTTGRGTLALVDPAALEEICNHNKPRGGSGLP